MQAQWHGRGQGMKVRYRGDFRDVVEQTNRGWRFTIEDRHTKSVIVQGYKYFKLQRDCIAALDTYLRKPQEPKQESESEQQEARHECECGGSGRFRAGRVENGKFVGYDGECYRCRGKGYQTDADVKRNRYYDNNVRRIRA